MPWTRTYVVPNSGRNAKLRKHWANPHWGILWTPRVSKSEKTRKDWRVDPRWIREKGQQSRRYHPPLELREATQTVSVSPEEGPEVTYYFPVWIIAPCFKNYICLFIVGDCVWVGGVCVLVCMESDNNLQELVFSFYLHRVWGRSGPHRTCLQQKVKMPMMTFRHRNPNDYTQWQMSCRVSLYIMYYEDATQHEKRRNYCCMPMEFPSWEFRMRWDGFIKVEW